MESTAMPWKFKVLWYFLCFKPCIYFLFKNHQFIFHLRINIPFFLGWPEAPKCIANYISFFALLFHSENIVS